MLKILDELMSYRAFEVPPFTAVLRLSITFFLMLAVSLLYKKLHRNKEDCHVMMHTMIYIAIFVTGAMIVIGSNMVVAFGLLGAVSIVRFRTAINNSIDMAYIVLSVIVGISSGLGFLSHALTLTVFVMVAMVVLNKFRVGMKPPIEVLYRISVTINKKHAGPEISTVLWEKLGKDSVLLSVETTKANIELRFSKAITGLDAVEKVYEIIENLFDKDESLKIRVDRKRPKIFG